MEPSSEAFTILEEMIAAIDVFYTGVKNGEDVADLTPHFVKLMYLVMKGEVKEYSKVTYVRFFMPYAEAVSRALQALENGKRLEAAEQNIMQAKGFLCIYKGYILTAFMFFRGGPFDASDWERGELLRFFSPCSFLVAISQRKGYLTGPGELYDKACLPSEFIYIASIMLQVRDFLFGWMDKDFSEYKLLKNTTFNIQRLKGILLNSIALIYLSTKGVIPEIEEENLYHFLKIVYYVAAKSPRGSFDPRWLPQEEITMVTFYLVNRLPFIIKDADDPIPCLALGTFLAELVEPMAKGHLPKPVLAHLYSGGSEILIQNIHRLIEFSKELKTEIARGYCMVISAKLLSCRMLYSMLCPLCHDIVGLETPLREVPLLVDTFLGAAYIPFDDANDSLPPIVADVLRTLGKLVGEYGTAAGSPATGVAMVEAMRACQILVASFSQHLALKSESVWDFMCAVEPAHACLRLMSKLAVGIQELAAGPAGQSPEFPWSALQEICQWSSSLALQYGQLNGEDLKRIFEATLSQVNEGVKIPNMENVHHALIRQPQKLIDAYSNNTADDIEDEENSKVMCGLLLKAMLAIQVAPPDWSASLQKKLKGDATPTLGLIATNVMQYWSDLRLVLLGNEPVLAVIFKQWKEYGWGDPKVDESEGTSFYASYCELMDMVGGTDSVQKGSEEEGDAMKNQKTIARALSLGTLACSHLGCTTLPSTAQGKAKRLMCIKCECARYCSKECQRMDWKKHKPACMALSKAAPVGP